MLPEPRAHRRRALVIALIAAVIVFILWNIPQISEAILYPFRLFVTYVHEAGHGTMAILTGGQFVNFEVLSNGAGQANTIGGSRLLILPAGYLGAALFGAVLFYVVNRGHYSRVISVALGIGLIVFSVLFGRFSATAFIVGLAFGGILIFIGRRASQDINIFVLNLLAIMTALNAVLDLIFLVGNSGVGAGALRNDAAAFSGDVFPLIPGAAWAFLWAAMAVLMMGVSIWLSVIRPLRQRNILNSLTPDT